MARPAETNLVSTFRVLVSARSVQNLARLGPVLAKLGETRAELAQHSQVGARICEHWRPNCEHNLRVSELLGCYGESYWEGVERLSRGRCCGEECSRAAQMIKVDGSAAGGLVPHGGDPDLGGRA